MGRMEKCHMITDLKIIVKWWLMEVYEKTSLFVKSIYYKLLTEEKLREIQKEKEGKLEDIDECLDVTLSEIVDDYVKDLREEGWSEEDIQSTVRDSLGVDYVRKEN
jgi:phosphotransacetylase